MDRGTHGEGHAGRALASLHDPVWLLLPLVAGVLLLEYLFFRGGLLADAYKSLGFRGSMEIDEEKYALRAFRGDFRNLPTVHDLEDKDSLCRFEDEGGPATDMSEARYDPREAAVLIVAATR
jgi:hypothetical protein